VNCERPGVSASQALNVASHLAHFPSRISMNSIPFPFIGRPVTPSIQSATQDPTMVLPETNRSVFVRRYCCWRTSRARMIRSSSPFPLIVGRSATGKAYRLPTEAEWEYAARSGGKIEKWAGTSSESELGDYAWYYNNSGYRSHPVGQKKPNGLGLYDMTGNVWEWMSDWYDKGYYAESPRDEPEGSVTGRTRSLRGGYWGDLPRFVRVSRRIGLAPAARAAGDGFRVALSTP
jgi:hypothetical protein